ncbi:hypothetical protein [Echinicola sp. 20G]|uniref:hypothetical protein n=1 Tax=Echinicola sp. 20G TaxID=2781961 RepID=UPI001910B19F|nr:hypothetical protein [Echinicola sp. 20G]
MEPGDFPPGQQFTEVEIRQVFRAFEKMLGLWNVVLDLPDALPVDRRYDLMVALLDQEFAPMNSGMFVFDFCSGYAPGCELGEYCNCLKSWKEED